MCVKVMKWVVWTNDKQMAVVGEKKSGAHTKRSEEEKRSGQRSEMTKRIKQENGRGKKDDKERYERVESKGGGIGGVWRGGEDRYCCHPSPAFRTSILALFTNALMSSSNALRSGSEAFGSPRFAAVESRYSGLASSSSNSCRISGWIYIVRQQGVT